MPTPGFLTRGVTNSCLTNFGIGNAFEMESIGVDVFTYQCGPIFSRFEGDNALTSSLFEVKAKAAAKSALAELLVGGPGCNCGTDVLCEMYEAAAKFFLMFPTQYWWFFT